MDTLDKLAVAIIVLAIVAFAVGGSNKVSTAIQQLTGAMANAVKTILSVPSPTSG